MKPRIRPNRKTFLKEVRFECQGFIPGTKLEGWAYGRTIEEAYQNWLDDPIPF